MHRNFFRAAFLSLFIVLAASACSEGVPIAEEPGTSSPEQAAVEEPVEVPEAEPAPYRQPLTGMPSEERLTHRPIVVMVENSPAARPQSGLDAADMVYEVLAEGDITRFIAVYHSREPERIGPVRSIRPYFVEIGDGLGGILVHAGWSQDAMNLMVKRKVNHLDQVYGDHPYYWRDKSRKAPHNVYTSIELIRKGAEAKKFRTEWADPVLTFRAPAGENSAGSHLTNSAASVTIPYIQGYKVTYEYDSKTGTYARSMAGKPHTDAVTNDRLQAANVLVVEAKHRIVDSVGRRDVDVVGPGYGYLFQEGARKEITWELKHGAIRAYDPKGGLTELPLVPGTTWVQIVPDLSKVTFE